MPPLPRALLALLSCLAACGAQTQPDGGMNDGGADAAVFVCPTTLIDTDAGLDTSALLGPACDPAELQSILTSCRAEPKTWFLDPRCEPRVPTLAEQKRIGELTAYARLHSCSIFGADVMHCSALRVSECADAGVSAPAVAGTITSECAASLGVPREEAMCRGACVAEHTACHANCRTCGWESCSTCSFDCGRRVAACLRACPRR